MSLTVQCGQCGKSYRVDDAFAGKRAKCKACGAVMTVPPLKVSQPIAVKVPQRVAPKPAAPAAAWDEFSADDQAVAESAPMERFQPAPASFSPQSRVIAPSISLGDPYFYLPGEEAIDAILPMVIVGAFLILAGWIWYDQISQLSSFIDQASVHQNISSQTRANAWGYLIGHLLGVTVVPELLFAGLISLAVFIASKILQFEPRPGTYKFCLIISLAPATALFAISKLLGGMERVPTLSSIVLATVVVMWLLLRLRIVHFLVTSGLSVALLLGVCFALSSFANQHNSTANQASNMQSTRPQQASMPVPQPLNTIGSLDQVRAKAREISAYKLSQIHLALLLYAGRHQGQAPASLDDLREVNLPADMLKPPDTRFTYNYRGFDPSNADQTVVIFEDGDRSMSRGISILFQNGQVKFFPDDTADAVLAEPVVKKDAPQNIAAANSPTVGVPTITAPRFEPPAARSAPGIPAVSSDLDPEDAAALQKLATALQAYASSHDGQYTTNDALVSAGLLQRSDLTPTSGHAIVMLAKPPAISPLPAEILIAYTHDPAAHIYVALFGDWQVRRVSDDDWRRVRSAAAEARHNANRAVKPGL